MSTADPLIGKKLGDYTIEYLLGRGGMARVYRGYDENLDRHAAVKIIESHLILGDDREEYYQRFQREARAIARLRHPNIVSVYQFGQAEDSYYMAMVFIEGEDLRHILKRHHQQGTSMSLTSVTKIMRAMTSALDYAHAEGVIHRDVKPSNILVTNDGNAVLTDFGLALNVPEGTIGNTFGSAHYIAPEQAVSSAQAVAQSDLYSLGICLYEMLTGRVPFDDNSAMSVALKHLSDPPPPPSELNPNIPPQVEAVIIKVLNKEPEDRYESGAAFMQAFEKALADSNIRETSELLPPSPKKNNTARKPVFQSSVPSPVATNEIKGYSSVAQRDSLLKQTSARLQQVADKPQQRVSWIIGGVIGLLLMVVILGVLGFFYLANNPDPTPTGVAAVAAVQTEEPTALPSDTQTPSPQPATNTAVVVVETEESTEIAAVTDEAGESTEIAAVTDETTEEATETNNPRPTITDTPEPTETPAPTEEVTEEITETPTDTSTSVSTEEVTEEVVNDGLTVEVRYDDRTFVLYNSSAETVDVSELVFTRELDNGRTQTFQSNNWRRQASRPPERLPAQDCYQIWTTQFTLLPQESYCDSRHAWRSVALREAFWISNEPGSNFTVTRDGEVIATCDIDAGRCEIPVEPR